MKKRLFLSIICVLALGGCGKQKEAVDLDMSAPASKPFETTGYSPLSSSSSVTSAPLSTYKGSDAGLSSDAGEGTYIKALTYFEFMEEMPEGALYYEGMIKTKLTFDHNELLALIHFDSDKLPELVVLDRSAPLTEGRIYSIGNDGSPYRMTTFCSELGELHYKPYQGRYSVHYEHEGVSETFYMHFADGITTVEAAVMADESGLPILEDGSLSPYKYYIDVPIQHSMAENLDLLLYGEQSAYWFAGKEEAKSVDEDKYKERVGELEDGGFVRVGGG